MRTDPQGNILCQKIGTKKKHYMSPLFANNTELMSARGWEIVETPQPPPKYEIPLSQIEENESVTIGEYVQPEIISTTIDPIVEYQEKENEQLVEVMTETPVESKPKRKRIAKPVT